MGVIWIWFLCLWLVACLYDMFSFPRWWGKVGMGVICPVWH